MNLVVYTTVLGTFSNDRALSDGCVIFDVCYFGFPYSTRFVNTVWVRFLALYVAPGALSDPRRTASHQIWTIKSLWYKFGISSLTCPAPGKENSRRGCRIHVLVFMQGVMLHL